MRFVCVLSTTAALLTISLPSAPARAEPTPGDALRQARSQCLTAVAKTVGLPRSRLGVISDHTDASGIRVEVSVPKATAPWACLTDRQGNVEDVHFTGSEGAL